MGIDLDWLDETFVSNKRQNYRYIAPRDTISYLKFKLRTALV